MVQHRVRKKTSVRRGTMPRKYDRLQHRPHDAAGATDEPNPNLTSPWRGPFTVRSQLSPVICRVARYGEIAETPVHSGRIKAYHHDATGSVPDLTALDDLFLVTTFPVPDIDGSVLTVHIGPYTIEAIGIHKRGPGKASLTNFQYHFVGKDKPSNLGILRHVNVVPQCHELEFRGRFGRWNHLVA